MKKIFLFAFLAFSLTTLAQDKDRYMGIIPAPVSVNKVKGEFKLSPETLILVDSPDNKAIRFFSAYLKKNGYQNSITDISTIDKKYFPEKNFITLSLNFKADMPAEGYELTIADDHMILKGRNAGMFYGIQTLIQLIQAKNTGYASIPCGTIKDHPRFAYRGMHLDVSRHFFDTGFVKRYIDVMAAYKLNIFHWHLTDDQGWRIEIKKYPKLTEVGSNRAQTKVGRFTGNDSDLFDNTPYGGFYTQDQVKDIVAYAAARYITIVPEIEMPGHSLAAVASYPEVSCDPLKPYKTGETWGQTTDVYCPTETTFKMLDDILLEVMDLFPGKYIHIGGDECPKVAWKQSDFCQQLIRDSSLSNEEGLQSYFIRRMERFINANGRSVIGWDEILEGGLAPNAIVMSWRGEKGGIAAAELNHNVIMTPSDHGMYFDHAQSKSAQEPLSIGGNAPVSKVYNYDPVPEKLTREQAKHIIGVQANLWTEYIATPEKAEYMLLPRMLALAEVAWSPVANKDYKNFSEERMPHSMHELETEGYNFRVPAPIGAKDTVMTGGQFTIELASPVEGAKIHYTIDGYTPGATDLVYNQPLKITVPKGKYIDLQTIVITPTGKRSNVTTMRMKNEDN